MSLTVIEEDGEPTHANSIRSQSRDGSVVPNMTPAVWNRGDSSMPTDLSCRWMISNVRARSWLPVVVKKRNDSLPTFGHEKILSLPALGRSGPPVQPWPLSVLMTLAWLNRQNWKFFWYGVSNGLKKRLWSAGRPLEISPYRALATCGRFMPWIRAWRTNGCFRAGWPFGPN